MTALLTDSLPLLAGAPNGIKKLRELILELAVRGKLVPQDPSDEPASELLKRVAVEKERLSQKVKKTSETSVCAGAFELPESWCWASFGDIAQHNSGKTLDKGRNSGVPRDYITTSNLYWGRFELSVVRQMLIEEKDLARCTAIMNDLLICEGGEAGRAAVWDQEREICFQNHVHRARFYGGINPHYAQRCFERLNYSGEIAEYRKGVGISNMSSKSLASIPVPLPPLAEQHRIVAKVDELMALCDRLEARQADADSAHTQLVQALLDSLTHARDAEDFAQSWQRLAEHFHTLFTTESSIDALKQTLLQLAVMGKLALQDDPYNENRSDRPESGSSDFLDKEAPPFEVPLGWHWVRLFELLEGGRDISYGVIKLGVEPKAGGVPVLRCSDVKPGHVVLHGVRRVSEKIEADYVRTRLRGGELIINIRGTLGGVALVDGSLAGYNVAREIAVVPVDSRHDPRFLLLVMLSPYFWNLVLDQLRGIAYKGLNLGTLREFPVPLPPLAEQHRIVAKVDELMSLCDQLKARLSQARQVHEHLASALVEQAVA
ncbi:restriction endonuclease subunit S [Pseudomonas putida]|nr:restriction endonuclease subunit S [Pseudomonas putida]